MSDEIGPSSASAALRTQEMFNETIRAYRESVESLLFDMTQRTMQGYMMTSAIKGPDEPLTLDKLTDILKTVKRAEPRFKIEVNNMRVRDWVMKKRLRYHKHNRRWVKKFRKRYGSMELRYIIPDGKIYRMLDPMHRMMYGTNDDENCPVLFYMNPNTERALARGVNTHGVDESKT